MKRSWGIIIVIQRTEQCEEKTSRLGQKAQNLSQALVGRRAGWN